MNHRMRVSLKMHRPDIALAPGVRLVRMSRVAKERSAHYFEPKNSVLSIVLRIFLSCAACCFAAPDTAAAFLGRTSGVRLARHPPASHTTADSKPRHGVLGAKIRRCRRFAGGWSWSHTLSRRSVSASRWWLNEKGHTALWPLKSGLGLQKQIASTKDQTLVG